MIEKMKELWPGWKTKATAVFLMLAGAALFAYDTMRAAGVDMGPVIPEKWRGVTYMAIALAMYFLRTITTEKKE
jgi:hypothetical protein